MIKNFRKKKFILFSLLSIAFVFILLFAGMIVQKNDYIEAVQADVNFAAGDGSELAPFEIATKEQLYNLANLINDPVTNATYSSLYYELTSDISFDGVEQWTPIGKNGTSLYFSGHFDGNGHTITNLTITSYISGFNYYGLFGYVKGSEGNLAEINRIGLIDTNINITSTISICFGTVAGNVEFTTISNCYNTGDIIITGTASSSVVSIGGIVGITTNSITNNCYNTGNLSVTVTSSSSTANVGGIVGNSNFEITNCHNTGIISATSTNAYSTANAGGIAGYTGYDIVNCYNTGNISATSTNSYVSTLNPNAGGIAGTSTNCEIYNCYNTGIINATGSANYTACSGGISGVSTNCSIFNCYNNGNIITNKASMTENCAGGIVGKSSYLNIYNCYNTGNIDSPRNSGGIAGDIDNSTITNCYNTGDISLAVIYSYKTGGITGRTSSTNITNCFNLGRIPNSIDNGAIIGYSSDSSNQINNCYSLENKEYISFVYDGTAPSVNTGSIKTLTQMTSLATYSNWDFEGETSIWIMSGLPYLRNITQVVDRYGKIVYDYNYSGSVDSINVYTFGSNITLPYGTRNITVGNGYNLLGWSETDVGEVACNAGDTYVMPNENVTLYAQWTETTIFAGGDGTENNPFQISNKEQLYYLSALINSSTTNSIYKSLYYKLTADITFASDESEQWTPIGKDSTYYFSGNFDGDGHTITNLTITSLITGFQYYGLFGFVKAVDTRAEISNIGLVQTNISLISAISIYLGSVAGKIEFTNLSNCYNTGDFNIYSNASICAGGIVGWAYDTAISLDGIINCYNTGNVTAKSSDKDSLAGGIVGNTSKYSVTNCYNTGNMTTFSDGSSYNASSGGIVGSSLNSNLSKCYNIGEIASTKFSTSSPNGAYSGGITGYINGCNITNCYNIGDVVSTSPAGKASGGIAGYTYNAISTITNCYNIGYMTSTSKGGIVGISVAALQINNCYALENQGYTAVYGGGTAPGVNEGYIDPLSEMVNQENYTNWDFTGDPDPSIWIMAGLPYLRGVTQIEDIYYKLVYDMNYVGLTDLLEVYKGGDSVSLSSGTRFGYYVSGWSTTETLEVVTDIGETFLMPSNNVTLYAEWTCYFAGGDGTENNPFQISNKEQLIILSNFINDSLTSAEYRSIYYKLTADITFASDESEQWTPIGKNSTDCYFAGHFDGNNHTITNLTITSYITGFTYYGLFGYIKGTQENPAEISNLGLIETNINLTGQSIVYGSIAGYLTYTDVTNCYNTGDISTTSTSAGTYSGGIAGNISYSNLINCYNEGNIIADSSFERTRAGGIIGYTSSSTITDCYNLGNISGNSVNYAYVGGISGYVTSTQIENCYSSGTINSLKNGSYDPYAGGIVGYASSTTSIIDCHNTGEITSVVYAGGISGLGGDITNCYNTGSVTSTSTSVNTYAGGITGNGEDIANCYNTGEITSGVYAGGIVAYKQSSFISNCYNIGVVSANSATLTANAGGIVGYNSSANISNCYNIGEISSTSRAGGIAGHFQNSQINNCYNIGTITATLYAGGIVGYSSSSTTIANCYNTENINTSAASDAAGGIVGYANSSTIVNYCYNVGYITTTSTYKAGIIGRSNNTNNQINYCYSLENKGYTINYKGTPPIPKTGSMLSLSAMMDQISYTNWDFTGDPVQEIESIWIMAGLPYLRDVTRVEDIYYGVVYNNDEDYEVEFYAPESTITLPTPNKKGYSFDGWAIEEFGVAVYNGGDDYEMPSTNVSLFAQWTAVSYSITYNLDNGVAGETNPGSGVYGNSFYVSAPTKEGCIFTGWTLAGTNPDYTTAFYGSTSTPSTAITSADIKAFIDETSDVYFIDLSSTVDGNITLTANWITIYTISYNLNGGTNGANPDTYTNETPTITLQPATKTGYTFNGWYDNAEFTGDAVTEITLGTTGDITLYAKFTINTYNITYNLNNGINGANPNTYTVETPTIILEQATKTGYTFNCWYDNAEFSGNAITEIILGSVGNVTFYAKFTIDTYTITYNLNGGTNGANPDTYTIETPTITLQPGTRTGYTFGGWYDNAEFTGDAVTEIALGTTGDIILYAKFTINTYNITYNLNSGTNGANPDTYTVETSTIILQDATRTGYTFEGWEVTDIDTETVYVSEGSYANLYNIITQIYIGSHGNITLTALLFANNYGVTFNGNGATGSESMNNQGFTYDIAQNLSLNIYVKTGFEFIGWNTESDGSGTEYTDGQEVINLTSENYVNVTLYAQWAANDLIFNGGTLVDATFNTQYGPTEAFAEATNGTGIYTYEIISGAPTGIVLNSDRTFSGTPTSNVGIYNILVRVTDSESESVGEATFVLEVIAKEMTYVVEGYEEEYDGSVHYATIILTEPISASVGYSGTEGVYTSYTLTAGTSLSNFTDMGRTNVGSTIIYYQITAENYTTVTGLVEIEITKITLDTPTNLAWNTSNQGNAIATWDAVDGAYAYIVTLYNSSGEVADAMMSMANSYNFGLTFIFGKCTDYYFTVVSKTMDMINYNDSEESTQSSTISSYEVTFDSNGGSEVDTQYIIEGQKVIEPDDPTLTGSVFDSWVYYDNEVETEWDFDDSVTADIELSAKWIQNASYTVRYFFQAVNGEDYEEDETETKNGLIGSEVTITPESVNGFVLNSDDSVLTGTISVEGDLVLSVYYDRENLEVVFTIDGEDYSTQQIIYEGDISLPANPTKSADAYNTYTFSHWSFTEGGEPATFNNIIEDINLYAVFTETPIIYSVEFKDAQEESIDTLETTYGESVDPDEIDIPEITGHTFAYWSLALDGEEFADFENITEDLVVYAVYSINIYKIKFIMPNGEKVEVEVEYGANITNLPKPETTFGDVVSYNITDFENITEDFMVVVKVTNYSIFYIVDGILILLIIILLVMVTIVRIKRKKKVYSERVHKELMDRKEK